MCVKLATKVIRTEIGDIADVANFNDKSRKGERDLSLSLFIALAISRFIIFAIYRILAFEIYRNLSLSRFIS